MRAVAATGLLSTAEVARRLGVKRETVYAYVSRGLLTRHPSSLPRSSLFDAAAVERLATRARRADRSGAMEVIIETHLTGLDPAGHLTYRGRDAVQLARHRSFESVAGLLWDGDPGAPWELDDTSAAVLRTIRDALPADTPASDLIPVAVAALAAVDPQRNDRQPGAVRAAGARMLAGALDVLPTRDRCTDRSAAARLWSALRQDSAPPRPAQVAALNAALVLLADHELSASALSTRVAASAWADPYRVVLAGLGPLGGTLHAGSSRRTQAMLTQIQSPKDASAVLQAQAAAGPVPGFGHRVYHDRDPRADHLLGRVPAISADPQATRIVAAVLDAAKSLGLPPPNADLGLSAVAYATDLRPDAATTMFTVARIAGLIAHALEEYPHRLRFRPRATYLGPL